MVDYDKALNEVFTEISNQYPNESLVIFADAVYQYSQNPTSMSAGYGVTENYQFIEDNLRIRYNLTGGKAKEIVGFVQKNIEQLQGGTGNYDIYFWREQINDFVEKYYLDEIKKHYKEVLERLDPHEKEQFSFLLMIAANLTQPSTYDIANVIRWYQCFFDPEEKARDNIELKFVRWGIANKLFYRSSGSSGYSEPQLIFPSYLREIYEELSSGLTFKTQTPERINTYLDELPLDQLIEIERMLNEKFPIGNLRIFPSEGILSASRTATALNPFILKSVEEAIRAKRIQGTKNFENKVEGVLAQMNQKMHPAFSYEYVLHASGAHCWRAEFLTRPDQNSLRIGILLAPWIMATSATSSIYNDFLVRAESPDVEIIFVFKESLPTLKKRLYSSYVLRRYVLFYNETIEGFQIYEQAGTKTLGPEYVLEAEVFLGKFLDILREKEVKIEYFSPEDLERRLEIVKFYNKFPRLVALRTRLPDIEAKLRDSIRVNLSRDLGGGWEDKIREQYGGLAKRWENTSRRRGGKDILDGTTFGELIDVINKFPVLKSVFSAQQTELAISILVETRRFLMHPLEGMKEDIPEDEYKKVELALQTLDSFLQGKSINQ